MMSSEITHFDTSVGLLKVKRKRKRRGKNSNSLIKNDLHHGHPKCDSSVVNDIKRENDSFQQPLLSTCLKADSELIQHDGEFIIEKTHSDKGAGQLQAKRKRKKKPGKNLNSEANNDLHRAHPRSTSIMNNCPVQGKNSDSPTSNDFCCTSSMNVSPLEHGSFQQPLGSTCVETDSKLMLRDSEMISVLKNSNTGAGPVQLKRKKRRKKQRKNSGFLTNNDLQNAHPKCDSSLNDCPLENGSSEHPLVGTCLKADSEIMRHDTELSSDIIHSDTFTDHLQAKGKTREKPGKNSNSQTNNNLHCALYNSTMDNRTLENFTFQQPLVSTCFKVDSDIRPHDADLISGITNYDTGVVPLQAKRKKRRKAQGKNSDSPTSDDLHHTHLKCTSSMNGISLENGSFQQPLVNACLEPDSKQMQRDSELVSEITRGKNLDSSTSDDLHHAHLKCTSSMNGISLENGSFQQPLVSACLELDSKQMQCDSELVSEVTQSDAGAGLLHAKRKRRKKKQKKSSDSLANDGLHHAYPKCTSVNSCPLENGSFQLSMVTTCSTENSELMKHDAEQGLYEGIRKGRQLTTNHNSLKSNSSCNDILVGDGMDSPAANGIKYTGEVILNSVSEATKHDDQAQLNNINEESRTSITCQTSKHGKSCKRRQEKDSDNLVHFLESKEGVGSSIGAVENRRKYTMSDGLVEEFSSGHVNSTLEREAEGGHDISLKVVDDILIDIPLGGCYGLEHASGCSKIGVMTDNIKDVFAIELSAPDLTGEDFEPTKRVKLDVDQNVLCNVNLADKQLKESTRFCEEKIASDDASAQNPPSDPRVQNRQAKSPSSTELHEMKDNYTQAEIMENGPPQMLLSCMGSALTGCFRRKLLVLDVNGLLADIVLPVRGKSEQGKIVGGKAIFKRPFCGDFLQFCFERFDVGIWSSRTKKNVRVCLDYLLGNSMSKLLFCWDRSHCTITGFNTLEDREKPLVLKELKKLWEKHDPNLPWERGEYNESNTLLLDDSPYKALRNPPYTAIFPPAYLHKKKQDNSLGPGGDLRVYLEGLALAENVQDYVEHNPFGQRPITEKNLSWSFYQKVVNSTDQNNSLTSNMLQLPHTE